MSRVAERYSRLCRRLGAAGCWPMDERAGTTAYDWSAFRRNGTYSTVTVGTRRFRDGTVTSDWPGNVNNYMNITDDNAWTVQTTGGLTVSAWVKLDALGVVSSTYPSLIAKDSGSNTAEWNLLASNGFHSQKPCMEFYNEARTATYLDAIGSATIPISGEWTFVLGTLTTAKTELYVNGRLDGYDDTTSGSVATGSTKDVSIGLFSTSDAGGRLNGSIALAAIFPYVLSGFEVAALYREGLSRE